MMEQYIWLIMQVANLILFGLTLLFVRQINLDIVDIKRALVVINLCLKLREQTKKPSVSENSNVL